MNHRIQLLCLAILLVLSGSALSADFQLTPGSTESGQYGWRWGSNANRDTVVAEFEATGSDLTLSVVGYDVDSNTEVSVSLNGQILAYLPKGSINNSVNGGSSYAITAALQIAGTNSLVFAQAKRSGWIWGVTDISINPDVSTGIDFTLIPDSPETGQYGWNWGSRANKDEVTAEFQNTGTDLELSVVGYDVDTSTEVSVSLNNQLLGYLPRSPTNNALNNGSTYTITAGQQLAGSNTLVFAQARRSGWKWGVTDVELRSNGTPPNQRPVAVDDNTSLMADTTATISVLANDSDTDGTLVNSSLNITTAPVNGTAVAQSDGTILYTHTNIGSTSDSFQYTVDDNLGLPSNVATVSLSITPPANIAPVAADDSASVAEGTSTTISVLINDTDPDGSLVDSSIVIVEQAANGTAVAQASGSISYTPSGNGSTSDTFKYTVSDDQGLPSNIATVAITISAAPNVAPIAENDSVSMTAGNEQIIAVLVNDSDIDGSIDPTSIVITRLPDNGTAVAQVDGTVLYTHQNNGSTTDSFEYKVSDDQGLPSNAATVTVSITPVIDDLELLLNPDFSNQLTDWFACDYTSSVTVVNNVAVLMDENCIHQGVQVAPQQKLEMNCDVRHLQPGTGTTGMSFSFYDASWNFISEPTAAQVTGSTFSTYTVTGTVPSGAAYAGAWVHTTSGAEVNACSLVVTGVEPPLTSDFCPAYDESPLYRERTNMLILGPNDTDWEEQIEQAQPNTEILLTDGEYLLDRDTIYMANSDITVRSLSGNQNGVVIRGLGYYTGQSEGFMVVADRITIADMTMYGMRRHAIAMKPGFDADTILDQTYIYNMNIYDTGTQHIKGADSGVNRDAVVACSTIGYNPGAVVGNYIGAIGIFEGTDVIVRDNYVYNITGDGSGCNVADPNSACTYDSVPAIYMRDSRDTIVERNTVVESWRGISLGIHNGHTRGIVRNNFVYRSGPGDHGISIELATDAIVEHNTVMVQGYWAPIEIRAGSGHTFRNNLTNAPIQERDGTFNNSIDGNGNIEYATEADFIEAGDPHLQATSVAIGSGVVPSEVTIDIDGDVRTGGWDVGADQYTP